MAFKSYCLQISKKDAVSKRRRIKFKKNTKSFINVSLVQDGFSFKNSGLLGYFVLFFISKQKPFFSFSNKDSSFFKLRKKSVVSVTSSFSQAKSYFLFEIFLFFFKKDTKSSSFNFVSSKYFNFLVSIFFIRDVLPSKVDSIMVVEKKNLKILCILFLQNK